MPLQVSRNVVVPLWIAFVALVAFVVTSPNVVFSLVVLVLGLAVPVVLVLWPQEPALQPVALEPAMVDRESHKSHRTR